MGEELVLALNSDAIPIGSCRRRRPHSGVGWVGLGDVWAPDTIAVQWDSPSRDTITGLLPCAKVSGLMVEGLYLRPAQLSLLGILLSASTSPSFGVWQVEPGLCFVVLLRGLAWGLGI